MDKGKRIKPDTPSPAADEVDDLDLISVGHCPIRPVGAFYDLVVVFNGNSLLRQGKMLDQFLDRNIIRQLAEFAVENDGNWWHDSIFALPDTISNLKFQI